MQYRRSRTHGGTFFFTTNLANRRSRYLVENVDVLRQVIRKVKINYPFRILAMVVLPDHLHTLWQLPDGESNYPERWALIKSGFSRTLSKTEPINESRRLKRERGFWQRRYWEHQIRDENDLARHVDYIHYNPVKHGYVSNPVDWPYSSIHWYIRQNIVSESWAGNNCEADGEFGE